MRKIGLMCLALVLALGTVGIGYAAWSETLTVSGTVAAGEVSLRFILPITGLDAVGDKDWNTDIDILEIWQVDKDVGGPTKLEEIDDNTLEVTLVNVYPWYFERIEFHAHNNGTIPVKIQKLVVKVDGVIIHKFTSGFPAFTLDLDGDTHADVKIRYMNNLGVQVHPCDAVEVSFSIVVLPEAPQNSELSFTLELVGIQYNLY